MEAQSCASGVCGGVSDDTVAGSVRGAVVPAASDCYRQAIAVGSGRGCEEVEDVGIFKMKISSS
jgi:hypothetical protein